MSATDNILRINNLRGVVTSLIDRGTDAKLTNQYYEKDGDTNFATQAIKEWLNKYNKKTLKEIPLDVVVRYSPSMSTAVTGNPVQIGVNVNDHTYNNPDSLVINFGTSDVKGTLARMSGLIRTVANGFDDVKNLETPSRLLLAMLYKAKEERTLFSVDDGLHTYTDMLITNIEYDKDKTTYRALVATVTLQQMIFVNVLTDSMKNGIVRTQPVALDKSTFAARANQILRINLI